MNAKKNNNNIFLKMNAKRDFFSGYKLTYFKFNTIFGPILDDRLKETILKP